MKKLLMGGGTSSNKMINLNTNLFKPCLIEDLSNVYRFVASYYDYTITLDKSGIMRFTKGTYDQYNNNSSFKIHIFEVTDDRP